MRSLNIQCVKSENASGSWIAESLKLVLFFALFAALCTALSLFGNALSHSRDTVRSSSGVGNFEKPPTVVIDAGHGGFDGGAVSADGIAEKDINLAIAEHLRLFFAVGGYDVVMTRSGDSLLSSPNHTGSKKRSDLFGRVETAQKYDNPLFISIHQNKFEIPKYRGLQVYYSKNAPQSEIIAKSIQSYARENIQPENNREAKPAGSSILVLDKLKTPAVLVECGFLSNPDEARLLSDDTYRRKLAFVIYLAVNDCLRSEGSFAD